MKRVLIVAAHPDDEVLGCGGMIAKLAMQDICFKVIFLGEGSTCRFDNLASQEASDAILARNNAAEKALKLLGVSEYEFHNLPCGRFDQMPVIEINKIIEKSIEEFIPDTVMTHSQFDTNNDHKLSYRATLMATRPGAKNHVKRLYSFEVLSSSEWAFTESFQPNFFVELSEKEVEIKWNALQVYDTETKAFPFPRSEEGIKTLARMRGMQAGFEFAESFVMIREFMQ